jgi:hypothetical protein
MIVLLTDSFQRYSHALTRIECTENVPKAEDSALARKIAESFIPFVEMSALGNCSGGGSQELDVRKRCCRSFPTGATRDWAVSSPASRQ